MKKKKLTITIALSLCLLAGCSNSNAVKEITVHPTETTTNEQTYTGNEIKLDIPFMHQNEIYAKGGKGSAVYCTAMLLNYYGIKSNVEDFIDEYCKKISEDNICIALNYTYIDPRVNIADASNNEGKVAFNFLISYLNKLGYNAWCDGLSNEINPEEQYTKEFVYNSINNGRPVMTVYDNSICCLVVGYNDDKNIFYIADPTKDKIEEISQKKFWETTFEHGGNFDTITSIY